MDTELAARLDVQGLRADLPPMLGEPDQIAVAEVIRLGLVAELMGLVAVAEEQGTPVDQILTAWRHWCDEVLAATTDAAAWVRHVPTRVSALSALRDAVAEEDSR